MKDEKELAGINISRPVLVVSHTKLIRSGDSPYRSVCPVCEKGVLLMKRNDKTFELEKEDNCILCGQRVLYDDLDFLTIV